ncbi:MAG: hypothetical protein ACOH17_01460 [Cellulomonas sp.]
MIAADQVVVQSGRLAIAQAQSGSLDVLACPGDHRQGRREVILTERAVPL